LVIVSLTYKRPLAEVDKHGPAHVAWLGRCYDAGMLIASGRKVPRVGGVIIAKGTMSAVKALCEGDPFYIHGVADHEFMEVEVVFTAMGLEALRC
jgi:uncharacterized protein YciI